MFSMIILLSWKNGFGSLIEISGFKIFGKCKKGMIGKQISCETSCTSLDVCFKK